MDFPHASLYEESLQRKEAMVIQEVIVFITAVKVSANQIFGLINNHQFQY